ncbi:uncharacterized protein K441DRAFT_742512 [Cenococcum geophilum 1.58]|uniref:Uncharacterized protein n=1 Tax=Cenococcum geophilum 1.58 TaxID=794803 RepID=A0ACC8EMI9_9PEZI|nr:hypothetical protein K441DRAFT_742512 [Cenococcum geophilum 1.58]
MVHARLDVARAFSAGTVEFFSKEGKQLGSRMSLEQEIHEITKIPIGVLRGQHLTEFSVEERMSWAASRTTTLEEDKVYCLLTSASSDRYLSKLRRDSVGADF